MASDSRVTLNHNSSRCSICHGDLKQLKFLDCHHTCCMKCIRDLDKKSPGTVSCPLCQRKARKEIAEKDFSWKTLYIEYDGDEVETEFNGVKFVFKITNDRTVKQGTISAIAFKITKLVDESRDIDYDISLVSKKVPVKRIGNCQLEGSDWFWIHFIQNSHAVDVENGFIVKERIDETGRKIQTFQLDVGIVVDFYKNVIKPAEGLQIVIPKEDNLQIVIPKEDNLQISKENRVRKTFYVEYDGDEIEVKFYGITFRFCLTLRPGYKLVDSQDLYIKISAVSYQFLESCDIDYDISLVNLKGHEYSIKRTGNCQLEGGGWFWIQLIQMAHILAVGNGFIVRERTDETGKKIQTFQLDVGIVVNFDKNTNKPDEVLRERPVQGLHTVRRESFESLISEKTLTRKTLYAEYDGNEVVAEFDGITFKLCLTLRHGYKLVYAQDLYIKLSLKPTSHLESCDINYEILLVNQKDRENSKRHTGTCKVTQSDGSPLIHLSNTSDAFNKSEGFIVKDKRDRTFQLDVDIKVRNKK